VLQFLLDNWVKDYTQGQLAEFLHISPSTVSRVAENLQRLGVLRIWTQPYPSPAAPPGIMKMIKINADSQLVQTLLDLTRSLREL
jgi:DNA-binding Lrp family transcriptional regulator